MKKQFLYFNIPAPPTVIKRMQIVADYAAQFLRHNSAHGSAREFAEQCGRDWKDDSIRLDVMREIRRLKRLGATA